METLRPCNACQAAKRCCSLTLPASMGGTAAGVPCSRCQRLGYQCIVPGPRKRACTACRRAKVSCTWHRVNAGKCDRCTRLGLSCIPQVVKQRCTKSRCGTERHCVRLLSHGIQASERAVRNDSAAAASPPGRRDCISRTRTGASTTCDANEVCVGYTRPQMLGPPLQHTVYDAYQTSKVECRRSPCSKVCLQNPRSKTRCSLSQTAQLHQPQRCVGLISVGLISLLLGIVEFRLVMLSITTPMAQSVHLRRGGAESRFLQLAARSTVTKQTQLFLSAPSF